MLKAIPPIDVDKLQEPAFSHTETLEITGLTTDTLHTWHKRGVLVAIAEEQPPGRGHRRRYSVLDLIYLSLLRELAGRIPLTAAGLVSVQGLKAVLATYDLIRLCETSEDFDQIPSMALIAYEGDDGQTQFNVSMDQKQEGELASPPGGIQSWMRSMNIRSAVVVDIATLTLHLFAKIGDVTLGQQRRQKKKPAKQ
ncbi:MAG: MerR family transcriptional regulator [Bryobacterales bacterium]|nr:MerR family transcriptional regulator [Bryobacterales bacterium]